MRNTALGRLTVIAGFSAFLASCTTDGLSEKPAPVPDASGAVLSSIEKLQPDTSEAALHDTTVSNIPYIGVWAADAAGCKKIDQQPYDSFAVITVKSLRQFEETCSITAAPDPSNPVKMPASCTAEGETSVREISLQTLGVTGLRIINKTGAKPADFVRCSLPK